VNRAIRGPTVADPHKGGLCPDGESPGWMRIIDDGGGLQTVECSRDGSWVQEVAATGEAVEYSDYRITGGSR
jgi:hypothetical protein